MHSVWEDMRYGLRMLRGHLGFTLVVVLTLGIGIAANTTVFGWIDSVVLHPQHGVGDPDGLYNIESVTSAGKVLGNISYTDYRDFRDHLNSMESIAVARHTVLSMGEQGNVDRVWGELVSANYFDVLRLKPVKGRWFLPEEAGDKENAALVAVISYRMWRDRYELDPKIIGKTIPINFQELTIVGVAPDEFPGSTPGVRYAVWVPISLARAMGTGGGTLGFRGTRDLTATLARLKPGVPLATAQGEVANLSREMERLYPATNQGIHARLVTLAEGNRGAQGLLREPLRILMAVCVLLFLIVCANVANLLLVRFLARRQEMAIRISMGAPRRRILRQLLTEAFLLAAAGGLAGVLFSRWLTPTLAMLLPQNDIPIDFSSPDGNPVLLFSAAATMAATVLCGMVPALIILRREIQPALTEKSRGGSSGIHTGRIRAGIVMAEVALATIALVGTGLFVESFRNATAIHPGFETDGIFAANFYLTPLGYNGQRQREYCTELKRRLEQRPGIETASYVDTIPLQFGLSPWHQVRPDGYTPAKGEDMNVHRTLIAPGYFAMMGIPLLEGRDFTEEDVAKKPHVAIVNQSFARKYFGGANPVGRRLGIEGDEATIVGMVRDSKVHSPVEGPTPYFYRPFLQKFAPGLNFSFLVKTKEGGPDPFRTMQREAVSVDPNARAQNVMWLEEAIQSSLYPQKVAASLLAVLGSVSLFLAMLGLFGVMSFAVAQRTREFAIRIALGAKRVDVLRNVAPQAAMLIVPGVAMGIGVAIVAGRMVERLLVGVSVQDANILLAATGLLLCVGLLATLVPAWNATRVNPCETLRAE